MYSKDKDKDILDLMDQSEILSSLPNIHRWNVLKCHGVKMDGYFINNRNSPRNRLMRNFLTFSEVNFYEEIKKERLYIIKAIILKGFTQVTSKNHLKHYQRKTKHQKI